MERLFAALRFTADENLADRLYWYLSEFPLFEGEEVLAPVGVHNRLQRAAVERTVSASEENAPYELSLIKRVERRVNDRTVTLCGCELLELGGVRYDEKHYLPFGRVLLCRGACGEGLSAYGTVLSPDRIDGELFGAIARAKGRAILAGEAGREAFAALIAFARVGGKALGAWQVGEETLSLLEKKLL